MAKRLLTTGSRRFSREDIVEKALRYAVRRLGRGLTVVEGGASGADLLVRKASLKMGLKVESHPADWSLGRMAGPLRNSEMVSAGADLCLAFYVHGLPCHGTRDCAGKAGAAGVEVVYFIQKPLKIRLVTRKGP